MHMQSNNDEKKYRFFDPFTGEAPLNVTCLDINLYPAISFVKISSLVNIKFFCGNYFIIFFFDTKIDGKLKKSARENCIRL